MKKYKIYIVLFFFASLISIYSNYKVWVSSRFQSGVIPDFNSQSFSSDNYMKFETIDLDYPNLGATALPMKGFYAKYHITFNNYYKALEILRSEENSNRYFKFIESLKAEAYFNLGIRDSAYYYSKEAYENLPQNPLHYQQYIRELTHRKDLKTIKKVFRERKADGFEYHRDFLSSSINLMEDDDQEIIESAKASLKLYPNNETIRALVAFLLYGETNVNQAYVVYQEGFKEFENNNFNNAANKFIEAFELFPMDYLFAENAGMSLVKNKNFKEAIEYFKKAIELENTEEKTGKSEFGLATCYFELNEIELACDFFTKSMILKYKPAFSSYNKLCGK